MKRLSRLQAFLALCAISFAAQILFILKKPNPDSVRFGMHPDDWPPGEAAMQPRRFRSAGHLLFHFMELIKLRYHVFEIYVLRRLPARFREAIMMRTAAVNDCFT